MPIDRAVGFTLLHGAGERPRQAAAGALERLRARMPWLARVDERVGGAHLIAWGHGDVGRAVRRTPDGGLALAVGDAPLDREWPAAGRLPWEGRGVLIRIAPGGDRIEAVNDWAGSIPVVHGRREGALIVSSLEPAVVDGLGLGPGDLDPVGVAALLVHGFYLGDLTLFVPMRALRPDHAATWTAGGFHARPLGTLAASQARWTSGWDELAEEMADGFRAAIRRALSPSRRWLLPLSGGIDSRLIAAVGVEAGHDLAAVSYGPAGWSDVLYARQVARRLGIPWRRVDLDERYLARFTPLWADWFGSALHFHGMYQMPFLEAVRGVDRPIVTGFTGDPLGGAQTEAMAAGDRSLAERLTGKWQVWPRERARALLRADPTEAFAELDAELARQWGALDGADFQRIWLIFQANHVARFSSYQPLMYDYWKGVAVPFVDRDLARFTLSLPRTALEGRRLQAHMIRRHFSAVATIPDTAHPEPLTRSRAHVARQAAAALMPPALRRGPLREFDPAPNTQDQDAARAGGPDAVWPLFAALDALDGVLDVEVVLREHRAALAGDLAAMTRVAAVQALAHRLAGPLPRPAGAA